MFRNVSFNFATAISKFDTFSSYHIVRTGIAKVTNFFPFCTYGISMYQKNSLPYFIILYFLTPSFFPFGAFRTERQISTPPVTLVLFFFHWARGALPAGATLLGWPNYGVDGLLNERIDTIWDSYNTCKTQQFQFVQGQQMEPNTKHRSWTKHRSLQK